MSANILPLSILMGYVGISTVLILPLTLSIKRWYGFGFLEAFTLVNSVTVVWIMIGVSLSSKYIALLLGAKSRSDAFTSAGHNAVVTLGHGIFWPILMMLERIRDKKDDT